MRKIGLFSFHKDPNYGTMYQAYALAKAIQKLGHNAEYIRYEAIPYRSPIKAAIMNLVKSISENLGLRHGPKSEYSFLRSKEFRKLKNGYKRFHHTYIPVSKSIYYKDTIQQVENKYDCFIIGSDQTWSSYCNTNPNTPFFLSFIQNNKKKCSYAPSIGSTHNTEEYKLRLKSELSSFDRLSCRENQNAQMLSKLIGKKVEYVLDPTLLLSPDEWQVLEEPVSMPASYVLCYILGTKACISDYAEKLGEQKGLPVYYMVTRPEYIRRTNALKDICPEQFLWLLHHATYIVTDSFHGSMFGINFKKDFFSFAKRETTDITGVDNDRILDFLRYFNIEDRFINDGESRIPTKMDYSVIEARLSSMRSSSYEYLKEITN